MRRSFTAVLGYAGAGLTLLIAVSVPFVLMGFFASVVAHTGLHVDEEYTGGSVARSFARNGYQITVYQPVRPILLETREPFVQITWAPVSALPAQVSDDVDLDGDGQPDVHVNFAVPADAGAPLRVDVASLNGSYQSLAGVGKESFSRLIVRTDHAIIVRVPLSRAAAARK
jgi:hypothetical protein